MHCAVFVRSSLCICLVFGLNGPANGELLPIKMPEIPSDLIYDAENRKFKLMPSPEEMAERLTDGSDHQRSVFMQLYESAMKEFDVKGYKWLMDTGESFRNYLIN